MNFLTFIFDLNLIVSRSSSSFVAKLQMTQHVHDGIFFKSDVNYNAVLDLVFTDMNPRISCIRHEEPFMIKRKDHHVLRFDYFCNINNISSGQTTLNNSKGDYVGLN